ncbi:MAG: flippase-like domain-containing protein [Chloroflexi bacterium]|nr:flippase-like domain-containing protein [Chloroflexota bacterium]
MAKLNSSWLKWVLRVVGTLVFAAIVYRLVDVQQLADSLLRVNPTLVIISILLVIPFIAIKSWRWIVILRSYGIELSFSAAWQLYSIGLSAGSFTPGQAGDAVKAWYLKALGNGLAPSLASVVLDRLFDIVILAFFALSSVFVFWAAFQSELAVLVLVIAVVLIAVAFLVSSRFRSAVFSAISKHLLPPRVKGFIQRYISREHLDMLTMSKSTIVEVSVITVLSFALSFFRVYLFFPALGLSIGPVQLVAVASLATIASLIPVSVGGIGTRDVTLIVIFQQLGFQPEYAISVSALILVLNLTNLGTGFLVWLRYPARLEAKRAKALAGD